MLDVNVKKNRLKSPRARHPQSLQITNNSLAPDANVQPKKKNHQLSASQLLKTEKKKIRIIRPSIRNTSKKNPHTGFIAHLASHR